MPAPRASEGLDFSAVIADPDRTARLHLVFAYMDVQRAICDRDWKLIRYPMIDRTQLFNLRNDAQETTDLADRPEHAARVQQMLTRLSTELRQAGDRAPLAVADPWPQEWNPPKIDR